MQIEQSQYSPERWSAHSSVCRDRISTDELANLLRLKPQTIRAAMCRAGHYMGLRPTKLPNGRLLWDMGAVECLMKGGAQ